MAWPGWTCVGTMVAFRCLSGMNAPDRRLRTIIEGLPYPRGASWDGKGVNFALFSAHATKVEVCLFDGAGKSETSRIELPEFRDETWHGYVPDIGPGTVYGFRSEERREGKSVGVGGSR